jgi:hypothetical protein
VCICTDAQNSTRKGACADLALIPEQRADVIWDRHILVTDLMSTTAPAHDADAVTQPTKDAAAETPRHGRAASHHLVIGAATLHQSRDGGRMAPHGVRARVAAHGAYGAYGGIKFHRWEPSPGSANGGDKGDETFYERFYRYTGLHPCSFPPFLRLYQSPSLPFSSSLPSLARTLVLSISLSPSIPLSPHPSPPLPLPLPSPFSFSCL